MTNVALLMLMAAFAAVGAEFPAGQIIDAVKCANDASQSYALYVPSHYSPDRTWPVIFAFDPAARGRIPVERFEAAAEQYGYLVAGSNNSRNGSADSGAAAQAMAADVGSRFAIDAKRIYLAGMSGGARVAMGLALGSPDIAGVLASSAGYPDSKPRKTVPFAVFGTAGTEDFNYVEMRLVDRALTTPHRLVIFDGGHTLPPDAVALEAIEWMELQAMTARRRDRDDALIDRLLAKRQAAIAAAADPVATVHLLDALVADFRGLRDVSAAAARADDLRKRKDVKSALSRERTDDDAEARLMNEILDLESGLSDDSRRAQNLLQLRARLSACSRAANAAADSPERRQARRVLRGITSGAAERVKDADYLKMISEFRLPSPGRGNEAKGAMGE